MAMKLNSIMYFQHHDENDDVVDDLGFFHVQPFGEDDLPLSQWELIDPSDADSDSDSDSDSVSSDSNAVDDSESLPITPVSDVLRPMTGAFVHNPSYSYCRYGYSYGYDVEDYGEDHEDRYDDDEDDDDDDDDGLDDELVPRHLRGKLERGRMRKLGKRSFSKMNSSKRSPHLYVKPGCLYGKHGLGLKHSL